MKTLHISKTWKLQHLIKFAFSALVFLTLAVFFLYQLMYSGSTVRSIMSKASQDDMAYVYVCGTAIAFVCFYFSLLAIRLLFDPVFLSESVTISSEELAFNSTTGSIVRVPLANFTVIPSSDRLILKVPNVRELVISKSFLIPDDYRSLLLQIEDKRE